jgi:hypothetical protein
MNSVLLRSAAFSSLRVVVSRTRRLEHATTLIVPHNITASSFSSSVTDGSNSGGFFGDMSGWMKNRSERKEKDRYMEQMERFSNMDVFTMEIYLQELKRGLSGFAANISFMQSKEVKDAKAMIEVVDKIIDVLGPNTTAEDLIEMDRLQRLKVATAANKTSEEISMMVSQINNIDIVRKALRKRRLEGKGIPQDQASLQTAVAKDARNLLSKSQMKMIRGQQEEAARRMARKRHR